MERSFHITHLVFGDIEDKVDVLRRRRHRKGRQSTAWSNDGAGIDRCHLFRRTRGSGRQRV